MDISVCQIIIIIFILEIEFFYILIVHLYVLGDLKQTWKHVSKCKLIPLLSQTWICENSDVMRLCITCSGMCKCTGVWYTPHVLYTLTSWVYEHFLKIKHLVSLNLGWKISKILPETFDSHFVPMCGKCPLTRMHYRTSSMTN